MNDEVYDKRVFDQDDEKHSCTYCGIQDGFEGKFLSKYGGMFVKGKPKQGKQQYICRPCLRNTKLQPRKTRVSNLFSLCKLETVI